jgi:predicted phosphate transport protein (TIGR00153 family)
MKVDFFLKLFVPTDTSFFPLFEEDAKVLIKAAELLQNLMATDTIEERDPIIKQIKAVEHEGDDVTHKIFQQLNKSFITPFDREDIQTLTSALDNIVDYINGTSQRIGLYKPKSFPPLFKAIADVIYEAAKEIEFSVHGLRNVGKNREKIFEACINLNTLENKADDLYHDGISTLFQEEKDTIELIKNKDIFATLEKTVDMAEDASDIFKTILIKIT